MASPVERFDRFVERALYGPAGFYTVTGRAGLDDGDFSTSVETSSLFGACVAGYLDETWCALGRPDPFVVIEAGSGPGRLCRDVFLAAGECRDALRYVMVERSDRQRQMAFGRVVDACFPGTEEVPLTAIRDLPAGRFTGVVLANELLDNLAPRLVERRDGRWVELYVDGLDWLAVDAEPAVAAMAERFAPAAVDGMSVPLQLKGAVWTSRALGLLDAGRVLVFDYGVPKTADLAARPRSEWLRGYRRHRRAGRLLEDPGAHDITCEVAFDQLAAGVHLETQAEWLRRMGLESMVAEAGEQWRRAAAAPSAADLQARQLLEQAAALVASPGLGDFVVAEWVV